jgi:hypothetical protein
MEIEINFIICLFFKPQLFKILLWKVIEMGLFYLINFNYIRDFSLLS